MYRTIVVGTDCSPTADVAVMRAAELAVLTGARLLLVSAYQESASALAAMAGASPFAHGWPESAVQEQRSRVEATATRLRAAGLEVDVRVEVGGAAETLVGAAEAVGADLLVVGDRGLKGIRGLLGSVPSRVSHRARLDILVVHTT